jgi:hypothetical protein
MRQLWLCALVTGCFASVGAAQPPAEAEAIIKKAIEAHGGENNLAKYKTFRVVFKITLKEDTGDTSIREEAFYQYPNKVKAVSDFDQVTITSVFDGTQAWTKVKTPNILTSKALAGPELEEKKESVYRSWIMDTIPYLKQPGFQVTALGESQVNGQAALGIKISSTGHRDVKFFYDKNTGLMVKMDTEIWSEADKKLVRYESYYEDYKLLHGVKIATKHIGYLNGKKTSQAFLTDLEFLDKLDPTTFAAP